MTDLTGGGYAGKVAVVTGAARGIGRAIATSLAARGAKVVIADTNESEALATARSLNQANLPASARRCDVRNEDEVSHLFSSVGQTIGPVEILVNNAGVLRSTAVENISGEEWDLVLDVNLKGAFLCAKAVLPSMKARRYGRIVNIASMAGRATSTLGGAHYTAAKAGLLGLSRHLAREAAPYGICVNAVCPGIVNTSMVDSSITPDIKDRLAASIPFARLAEPAEIAQLVCFLASDDAAYITGASVDIHGGEMIIQ
jgi:3-oxoacyl-[acyl-carrier protein] reductase